jgi:hypothetical protein
MQLIDIALETAMKSYQANIVVVFIARKLFDRVR